MSTFTSSGGLQSVVIVGANAPTVSTVDATLAGTEYSYVLPAATKKFLIKARQGAPLLLAYESAASAYIEIPRWCFYSESDLSLAGLTLYFQSPAANQVVEIVTWT